MRAAAPICGLLLFACTAIGLAGCALNTATAPDEARDGGVVLTPYAGNEPVAAIDGTTTRTRVLPDVDAGTTGTYGEFKYVAESYREVHDTTNVTTFGQCGDVLWPGALVSTASLQGSVPALASAARAPMTLRLDATASGGPDDLTAEVGSPAATSVADAVAALVAELDTQHPGASVPAELEFGCEAVHSATQLAALLSTRASWCGVGFSTQLDYALTSGKSRICAWVRQVYYTVGYASPRTQLVEDAAADPAGAVYVSSVKYGRLACFLVESTRGEAEVVAALRAAYNTANGASVDAGTAATARNVLGASRIATVIYGAGTGLVERTASGFGGVVEGMRLNEGYSAVQPALPLYYEFRYADTGAPVSFALASEYAIARRVRTNLPVRVSVESMSSTSPANLLQIWFRAYQMVKGSPRQHEPWRGEGYWQLPHLQTLGPLPPRDPAAAPYLEAIYLFDAPDGNLGDEAFLSCSVTVLAWADRYRQLMATGELHIFADDGWDGTWRPVYIRKDNLDARIWFRVETLS